ncbi:unnamed protein product [Nippostrongylus brasiliensis]|uniref:Uncharacterized protein n=1 Tax=Nippostrongylus brasiliensis TaxID=27835 RepID=A0A0N4YIF0_NIPBR|nr:unnamed protein product [Nippostrongylus brasiliensis]
MARIMFARSYLWKVYPMTTMRRIFVGFIAYPCNNRNSPSRIHGRRNSL